MTYRDERDALRARVESLEEKLGAPDSAEVLERALRPDPSRKRRRLVIGAAIVGALGVAAAGGFVWSQRAAAREIDASWSRLSACLMGEPLASGEAASSRGRRIQLALASAPPVASDVRWPGRCQERAHQLYQRLREDGRAEEGVQNAAYFAETLAKKLKQGAPDDEVLGLLDALWKQAAVGGLVAKPSAEDPAPAPATPLHLHELGASLVTTADTPMTSLQTEALVGLERHVVVDAPQVDPALLCTFPVASSEGRRAALDVDVSCRRLPGALGHTRGLRLLGTTDPGAAPLVFAGQQGADGIYRSDTGELVASVKAHSGWAAAGGYVAIVTWPDPTDGHFDVIEQRAGGAEKITTTVKPEAQTQPVTLIHRIGGLWDKLLLQLIDKKHPDTSPWMAFRSLGKDSLGGAFQRIGDLNWINTTIGGCKSPSGLVARVGYDQAYLLFNQGDTWRGPLPANGLGELRCDGADAVFLTAWPPASKRCTPAGCTDESTAIGAWSSSPRRAQSDVELVDGKLVAAWGTERGGVRFRVGTPGQIGAAANVVAYDDLVDAKGELSRTSNLSALRLVASDHAAVLLLATSGGVAAIRIGVDGSFAPAKVGVTGP